MNDSSKNTQKPPIEDDEKIDESIMEEYKQKEDLIDPDSRSIKFLSRNTYYFLRKAGINNVDDLCNCSQADLLKLKDIGQSELDEIVEALKSYFDIYLPISK